MKAIILAAGQGKRMRTNLQKVMHPILGKTIIQYVVEAALNAGIEDITVVISPTGGDIQTELTKIYPQLHFAIQETPLGTGHAVQAGVGRVQDDDDVLILYGDLPLITGEFFGEVLDFYNNSNSSAIVTAAYNPELDDFGRVYADEDGAFEKIVEAKDADPSTPFSEWVNTGNFIFNGAALKYGLSKLDNKNSQGEYYLTDIPKILRDDGYAVNVYHSQADMTVFTGINTQVQLAEAVGHMQDRINERHMLGGVRMVDPFSTYIDDTVELSPGVVIYPNVILEGACKVAEDAIIGANSHLQNTVVGVGAHIRQSVLIGANIGAGADIGPFAYLRPDANIGNKSKIGSFVEVKKANVAENTKIPHLTYIGDADIGSGTNIGCGTITANYDGVNKFRTIIGDDVFVGSNVNLVAPVKIGNGAYLASGSTINKDVPEGTLAIARARQEVKTNWNRPK